MVGKGQTAGKQAAAGYPPPDSQVIVVGGGDYSPGRSALVDYAVQALGAKVVSVRKGEEARPPFRCLTGVSNTSDGLIDRSRYPGVVAAGVDTLELNYGVNEYREAGLFEQLSDRKSEAVASGYKGRLGVPVKLCGSEFMVQSRGSKGGYEYLLKNGDIELQMMPDARGGSRSPEARVVFRSAFLWEAGEVEACKRVAEFVNELASIAYCRVSRADLCVDKVMPLPEIDRKAQVVTRLRERDSFYGGDFQTGLRGTGYQFGRGSMSCRFYDKAYETSVKRQGHIRELWSANGWDGKSPVSRLEVQLRREGLRRFDVNMDLATFQYSKSDIWAYMTSKYIRIVEAGSATRRERAKETEYWREYHNCYGLFGERQGVLPIRRMSSDWQPLVRQAMGCLASAWARLAVDVGEAEATRAVMSEWECRIPEKVMEIGSLQKARFGRMEEGR